MTNVDVTRMTYSELVALSKQLEQQIQEKREEELKVLVDGFAKKLEAAGFSVSEGVTALAPYLPATGKLQGRNSVGTAPVLYRDTSDPSQTWSGRGRAPRWLQDYLAAGRSKDEFKV